MILYNMKKKKLSPPRFCNLFHTHQGDIPVRGCFFAIHKRFEYFYTRPCTHGPAG